MQDGSSRVRVTAFMKEALDTNEAGQSEGEHPPTRTRSARSFIFASCFAYASQASLPSFLSFSTFSTPLLRHTEGSPYRGRRKK